ncbi:NfeD family protein [Desulfothermus naphthae]
MFEAWHLWIIAGIFFWIFEIFTSGFLSGILGTACFIVIPFAYANVSFVIQLLVFTVATALMSLWVRPIVTKLLYPQKIENSTNVDALMGMSGIVVEPIDNVAGTGRVKIGGEIWRAITKNDDTIDIGQKVIVLSVEGCKVIVTQKNKEEA